MDSLMKTKYNEKSDTYTISGLTREQYARLKAMTDEIRSLAGRSDARRDLKEDGYANLVYVADADEIEVLNTINF